MGCYRPASCLFRADIMASRFLARVRKEHSSVHYRVAGVSLCKEREHDLPMIREPRISYPLSLDMTRQMTSHMK